MRRISIAAPDFTYEGDDPEGFRSGMARLGPSLGAKESGVSVYELPPGQSVCPFHWEAGEEEWLLVLEGNPTVRHPDGTEVLEPWDLVCFPRGPQDAHRVGNESEETVRVLMFSTVVTPTATVYPDSDKVGVWTGDPASDLIAPRDSAVEYFDGET